MKQIANPDSMHETGCSGLVHWDDPEGWDGEGGGRGVQDGEHTKKQCIGSLENTSHQMIVIFKKSIIKPL